jgi:signal peptidase II
MWPAIAVAGAIPAADLVSKAWALRQLPSDSSTSTTIVQLRHVTNRGASFGLGAQHPAVVVILALVTTLAVGWWLAKADSAGERVAVAVVLGGALGNLIDRLANGAVTDWIGIPWCPATFNLADVAIRGGAVAALVMREVHRRRTRLSKSVLP